MKTGPIGQIKAVRKSSAGFHPFTPPSSGTHPPIPLLRFSFYMLVLGFLIWMNFPVEAYSQSSSGGPGIIFADSAEMDLGEIFWGEERKVSWRMVNGYGFPVKIDQVVPVKSGEYYFSKFSHWFIQPGDTTILQITLAQAAWKPGPGEASLLVHFLPDSLPKAPIKVIYNRVKPFEDRTFIELEEENE